MIHIINQLYNITISNITVTITSEIAQLKTKIDNLTNNMIKQNSFNITPTMSQMLHMSNSANANFANANSANVNFANANTNTKISNNTKKPLSS